MFLLKEFERKPSGICRNSIVLLLEENRPKSVGIPSFDPACVLHVRCLVCPKLLLFSLFCASPLTQLLCYTLGAWCVPSCFFSADFLHLLRPSWCVTPSGLCVSQAASFHLILCISFDPAGVLHPWGLVCPKLLLFS